MFELNMIVQGKTKIAYQTVVFVEYDASITTVV